MSEISVAILGGDKKTGKVDLPSNVFGCEVNVPLIHQVVVAQLAAARQGTHATKTRGDVRGGGAKPWRQKGTGRARHGSRRAPQWTGGGTVHGPQPRSYAQRTPKKMIAAALRSALSERYADGKLFVIENLASETPSTRQALQALSVVGDYKSAVVVLHRDEDSAWLSLRNVVNVHAIAVDQLNTYDVVANEVVVFTKDAMDDFIARTTSATESKPVIVPAAKKKAVKETKVKPAKVAKAPVEEVAPPAPVVEEVPAPVEEIVEAVVEAPVVEEPVLEEPVVEAPIEETPEVVEVVEEVAEVTKPAAKTAKAVKAEVAPEDKPDYGEGSYRGENPPEGFDIKGNEDSMLFHTPASRWYSRTVAEIWFNSEEAATAAGFTDVMENKK